MGGKDPHQQVRLNSIFSGLEPLSTSSRLHDCWVQVRFLSHLPLNPEFVEIAGHMAPAQCMCFGRYLTLFDPNLTSPGAARQIDECGAVGDWLPGTAGYSRLCAVISNLAASPTILWRLLGSGSSTLRHT
jgi:hypothetical protein